MEILLPLPRKVSAVTVEEALLMRRSVRNFSRKPIALEHLSMVLWAAYGISDPLRGFRSSPSAGATYPLEVYAVVGESSVSLEGGRFLAAGVYKYNGEAHAIRLIKEGDIRQSLYRAALNQTCVKEAPVDIVVTGVFERTVRYYGERGRARYVPMDVGHLGENIYLMATALGLGTVAVGAFSDEKVAELAAEKRVEVPLYIMPLGWPEERIKASFEEVWKFIEKKRMRIA